MKEMRVQQKKMGDTVVVRLTGDLAADVELTGPDFFRKLIREGAKKIVLNMEDVASFYSSSVNHLVQVLNVLEEHGSGLYLINVSELVRKVLDATNMDKRVSIFATEYDFIIAFGLMDSFEGREGGPAPEGLEAAVVLKAEKGRYTILLKGSFIEDKQAEDLVREVEKGLAEKVKEIVIDLKQADFISSPIVSKFLMIHRMCSEKGARVRLVNANAMVKDVFHLTDVGEFFGLEK